MDPISRLSFAFLAVWAAVVLIYGLFRSAAAGPDEGPPAPGPPGSH